MLNPTCTIPDCIKPARSAKAILCPMHYHRRYRHGSTDFTSNDMESGVKQVRAYRTIPAKGHPLVMKNGRAYEHRLVLYNDIGSGEHSCHWCGIAVEWSVKGSPRNLIPDHVNGIEDDNRIENLVPSCHGCNVLRGTQARSTALRKLGMWSENDTIEKLSGSPRRELIGA